MPRARKPSPEQRTQDTMAARGCHFVIGALLIRNANNGELRMAQRCLDEFMAPEPTYRDGKSAAAHDDTRELAHHPV